MWKRFCFAAAVIVLGVSIGGRTAQSQLISSFENNLSSSVGVNWEGPGVTPPTYVTTGATEGSYALSIAHPTGWTIEAILKGQMSLAQDVANHDFLLMDVTTTDLGIANDGWSPSWRQVFVVMNSSVGGWQQVQLDVPVAADDGGSFTYGLILDLNTEYDPANNPGKTLKSNAQEYVSTGGGAGPYFELFLPMQGGDQGTPVKAGDYNNDSNVNAADFVIWRDALAGGSTLANETASPGVVDMADYTEWRAHFGNNYALITTIIDNVRLANAGAGAGGLSASAIPEPSSIGLALVAVFPLFFGRPVRSTFRL